MKKSEPILPLPIYDDLFDQNRFNSLCEPDCTQQLIFSTNELPSFQFLRDKSLEIPSQLVLRNSCNDASVNYYKLIPESWHIYDQKFIDAFGSLLMSGAIYDNGIDPPFGTTVQIGELNCGVLKEKELPQFYTINDPAPLLNVTTVGIGIKVHFKIALDLFLRQNTFSIEVYDGTDTTGLLIGTINSTGVYNYNFVSQNGAITLAFSDYEDGDKFSISYIQAEYVNPTEVLLFQNDQVLSLTNIRIRQTATDKDIITYCNQSSQYAIEPGDYYYILVMENEIYFSEVFTLKTPKTLENYYRLTWYNSCDISDTIMYSVSTLACFFYNLLYLDAALFNAEYQTEDDGEENGLGDRISNFRRWQKTIKLEIPKSPNFLTDALSAVYMHDTVKLRDPINTKKENPNTDYSILNVVPEVQEILLNCYQNVKLKLLLNERYISKNCCDPISQFECGEDFTPTLDNVSEPISGVFLLEGTVMPGTFAVVEYKLNNGSWTQTNVYKSTSASSDGSYAVLFDTNGFTGVTDLDVRIRSKTLSCDKGISSEIDLL